MFKKSEKWLFFFGCFAVIRRLVFNSLKGQNACNFLLIIQEKIAERTDLFVFLKIFKKCETPVLALKGSNFKNP